MSHVSVFGAILMIAEFNIILLEVNELGCMWFIDLNKTIDNVFPFNLKVSQVFLTIKDYSFHIIALCTINCIWMRFTNNILV